MEARNKRLMLDSLTLISTWISPQYVHVGLPVDVEKDVELG